MSAAIVIAVALAGGLAAAWLRGTAARIVAGVALAACVPVALLLPPLTTVVVGGATFALGAQGAAVTADAAASLLLVLAAAWAVRADTPAVPVALALALAAVTAALAALNGALMEPPPATAVVQSAGTAGPPIAAAIVVAAAVLLAPALVSSADAGTESTATRTASRALRTAAVAGAIAVVGMAWLLGPAGPMAADPGAVAVALLLVAGSVALFLGAIPFHAIAARGTVAGPTALAAARAAWLPAAFTMAAVAWEQRVLAPVMAYGGSASAPLVADVRDLVAVVACLTLAGGAIVAALHDDLRHVLAYTLVSDAGLALLAFASSDPSAGSTASYWLPVNAVARTALAAWILVAGAGWGTSRIDELDGWARRAPLLAAGLVAVALATFGLPGWSVFSLRTSLAQAAGGPAGTLMLGAAWLGLLPFLRLAWVGLRAPSELVGERMVGWPAALGRAGGAGRRSTGATEPAAGAARPPAAESARPHGAGAVRAGVQALGTRRGVQLLAANGPAIGMGVALIAGLLAVAVSVVSGGALGSMD